jgi:parallel beta-helix repeat protein
MSRSLALNLFRLFWAATIAITILAPSPARSDNWWFDYQDDRLYFDYFEATGWIGDERNLGQANLFLRGYQTDYQLVFADIRGNWVEPETGGVNLGLAYRSIGPSGWIFGRYAYFDQVSSPNDNYFAQAALGLEWMNVDWDFRVNGYFPQNSAKKLGDPIAEYHDGTIVVRTEEELAYYGTDFEAGFLVADWADGCAELRAYATGFYFDRGKSRFETIAGGRARLELRLFDLGWLGEGSRVMIGGQFQWDDVRGDVTSGLVSVRIPLGCKTRRRPNRLQRRMLNPIVREPTIVTNTGISRELALDAETGAPFGPLTLIDANTSDVHGSILAAGDDGLIVADGSAGQIDVIGPLALRSGQILRGAGFEVIGQRSGARLIFGSEPTIHGIDPAQDVVTLAGGVVVRDNILTGGRHGIYGDSVSGFRIADNRISGAQMCGIRLEGAVGGDILGNSSNSNGVDGLQIDTYGWGTVNSNTFNDNGMNGLSVTTFNGGTISENTAEGNPNDGFVVSTFNDGALTANQATGNGGDGFRVLTFHGGSISNNTADGNTGDGFQIDFIDFDAGNNPSFSGNTAIGNTIGFHFLTMDGGDASNNTAEMNTGDGFLIETMSFGTLMNNVSNSNLGNGVTFNTLTLGIIDGNTADGNAGHGLFIDRITNGGVGSNTLTNNLLSGLAVQTFSNGQIHDNMSDMNAMDGYTITDFDFGLFYDNNASANGLDGYNIANMTFGATVDGNTATGNSDDGFDIGSGLWEDGRVVDNVSNDNAAFGFRITNRTGGSASGNSATGNADNTLPAP